MIQRKPIIIFPPKSPGFVVTRILVKFLDYICCPGAVSMFQPVLILTPVTPPGTGFLKTFRSEWHFLKSIKISWFHCVVRWSEQVAEAVFSCSSTHQPTGYRLCYDSLLPHVYVAAHGRGSLRVSQSHDVGQNSQNCSLPLGSDLTARVSQSCQTLNCHITQSCQLASHVSSSVMSVSYSCQK